MNRQKSGTEMGWTAVKNGLVCNSRECEIRADRGAVTRAGEERGQKYLGEKHSGQENRWVARIKERRTNNGQKSHMDKRVQGRAGQTDAGPQRRLDGESLNEKGPEQRAEREERRAGDTWSAARHQRQAGRREQGRLGTAGPGLTDGQVSWGCCGRPGLRDRHGLTHLCLSPPRPGWQPRRRLAAAHGGCKVG